MENNLVNTTFPIIIIMHNVHFVLIMYMYIHVALEKVAVLFGNSMYAASSFPDLCTPENDLRALSEAFTDCGFKVTSKALKCKARGS